MVYVQMSLPLSEDSTDAVRVVGVEGSGALAHADSPKPPTAVVATATGGGVAPALPINPNAVETLEDIEAAMARITYPPILEMAQLHDALAILEQDEWVSLDLETSGLSPWLDRIAVVTLHGVPSEQSVVLHVRGKLPDALIHWLANPRRKIVGHNITAFDLPFLYVNQVDIFAGQEFYDTLPGEAASLKTGRRDISVSLRATLARRLRKELDKTQQVSTWMAPYLTPEQIDYCVNDVRHLPALRKKQLSLAGETETARAIAIEQDIATVVTRMTVNGLPISRERLDEYLALQDTVKDTASARLFATIGAVNLRSHVQLRKAFADSLGVNLASTAKDALKDELLLRGLSLDKPYDDLRADAEALERPEDRMVATAFVDLLSVRYADQRKKMYRPEWCKKNIVLHDTIAPWDGVSRIHSRFWQVGTDTGRFSSSDPNLQQIPQDMRAVFGYVPGHVMIACDYSQIEVRLAACIANDTALIDVFNSGEADIHRMIASQVFGKPPEQISKRERKLSKAMVFTLLFGGGPKRLYDYARHNGSDVTELECQQLVARFFSTFTGLRYFRERAKWWAKSGAPTRLKLPTGLLRVLQADGLTATRLLNTMVQGSAAAGLKFAMQETKLRGIDRYLCATVHDELVAVAPEDEAEDVAGELTDCMIVGMRRVPAVGEKLPIEVEQKIGVYWR